MAEKEIFDLKQEIIDSKRIMNMQGKSLEKITNHNDYPQKIKTLMDDLKYYKDKVRDLEETRR